MSTTKFTEFERFFIMGAIKAAVREAEEDLEEKIENFESPMFSIGDFESMGEDIMSKVDDLTIKKE